MAKKDVTTIDAIQEDIVAEFQLFGDDYESAVSYIMEFGEGLAVLSPEEKCAEYLVEGCLAKVWLVAECQAGRLFLRGDSSASITKGLLALLLRVFSGQPVEAIVRSQLFFPKAIGLGRLISVQRQGGLEAVARKIVAIARHYYD